MDSVQRRVLGLDDTVHQKTRLAVLAMLSESDEVSFVFLRDGLGLTDGNLGRHLDILLGAQCIDVRREYTGRRTRSWIRITELGSRMLRDEAEVLRALLHALDRR
ncbi:transcriptional regulator [Rhodococcus sp. PAM 2766]|uniref:Transcriptional regulator n=1 Tax=Rhodococcus parequi TaxID=3137122 RepID=A0ABW9FDL3_9NOCA